jgi:hypothetical protein
MTRGKGRHFRPKCKQGLEGTLVKKSKKSKLVKALFWWKMGEAEGAEEAELG